MEIRRFNAFDAIQAGMRHLGGNALTTLRTHWLLLAAASVVLTMIGRLDVVMRGKAAIGQLAGNDPSLFDTFKSLALALMVRGVTALVLCHLATALHAAAVGRTSRGWAWKLGTADPPLLGLTTEQVLMVRSSARRVLTLWPGFVMLLAVAITASIDFKIAIRFGQDTGGLKFMKFVMQLVSAYFLLWYLLRVARHFLFRPAVIVETGEVDETAISSWVQGSFPGCLRHGSYWSCAILIVAAWAPMWAIDWLRDKAFEELELWNTDTIPMFIGTLIGLVGWSLSLTFLAGAVAFARGGGAAATEAATAETTEAGEADESPAADAPASGGANDAGDASPDGDAEKPAAPATD